MKFAANILTPVTAFCLLGSGSDWATRQKHFDQPIVEKATAESAAADTAFLAVHCNEQTEDPRLAHAGAQTSSSEFEEPTFLKRRLLFTPTGLKLAHIAGAWFGSRRAYLFIEWKS